jgi:hypothetical protein
MASSCCSHLASRRAQLPQALQAAVPLSVTTSAAQEEIPQPRLPLSADAGRELSGQHAVPRAIPIRSASCPTMIPTVQTYTTVQRIPLPLSAWAFNAIDTLSMRAAVFRHVYDDAGRSHPAARADPDHFRHQQSGRCDDRVLLQFHH